MSYRRATFAEAAPVIARLTGDVPAQVTPMDEGAYSFAGRWIVRWGDGRSAFVKAEWQHHDGLGGINAEHAIYSTIQASCLPRLIAYSPLTGSEPGVLLTEDLSSARWGVPLEPRDAEMFLAAVDELETVNPPHGTRPVGEGRRWPSFLEDPAGVLATGLFDAAWLERNGPVLAGAEASVNPSGPALVHEDLWLQNWCRADRGVVMVDWANSARGSADVMRAWGEAAVRAAGGPCGIIMPAGHPGWPAWMAGLAALFLVGERDGEADARLLETMRREAIATVAWACDEAQIERPVPAPGFDPGAAWRP